MSVKKLWNDGWTFLKQALGDEEPPFPDRTEAFQPVEIPHDWLIYDTNRLYENSRGCYRKEFYIDKKPGMRYALRFEGVYMDSEYYVNGSKVFEWKYGYSTFEFDITDSIETGKNEILALVTHRAPNSRWYSGAGIYRSVWLKEMPCCRIAPDGLYVTAHPETDDLSGNWLAEVNTEIIGEEGSRPSAFRLSVFTESGEKQADWEGPYSPSVSLTITNPRLWDLDSPARYVLRAELISEKEGVRYSDTEETGFGLRTIRFDPDRGFFLNQRKVKLHGVCLHHDLGCLGAAMNKTALRRQLAIMKEMGVNAVRTSHNMPSVEMMDLSDEMGILVVSESFDCWERAKTTYDYARFFKEWAAADVKSWVRRDRNHPSVIMWSIGNEIYDTHADERGQEITRWLTGLVREHDPKNHAPVTIGSNYMPWENAQKCADIVKLAGYNYAEKYYDEHHRKHPDWIIYGSETSSTVQSRGIYHFPLKQPVLADDDGQCSSLGNSSTSWGAKSTRACIIADRDADYSPGQFIWSGFDYIGEPTPYHTKNSYFGQVDTAGFKKDSFYIYQAEWTDYKDNPMVHIFPYWDFNPGQLIDVRVCSNAPKIELLQNGVSLGIHEIDHRRGRKLIGEWQIPYETGTLLARAMDEEGRVIAEDVRTSFGDAASLKAEADRYEMKADGRDLIFVTITAEDAQGAAVENANCRVTVTVTGAGRLAGLDNGDSTDYDQYKGFSRRLFSGKLLAVIAAGTEPGDITVTARSEGLAPAGIRLRATPCEVLPGISVTQTKIEDRGTSLPLTEIPVRKIELTVSGSDGDSRSLTPDCPECIIHARLYPENTSYRDLEWRVTNDAGIDAINASLEVGEGYAALRAVKDGAVRVRCMTKNGRDRITLISQLEFDISGFGEAFLNPYRLIAGGLYHAGSPELTNGNDHGVATARDGVSRIGFSNVDFGEFGSDEITLRIFAMSPEPLPVELWEGMPQEKGGRLIATLEYTMGSIWNTYQDQTFHLPERLKGVKALSFAVNRKIHFGGFSFTPQTKAFARLSAIEYTNLYGDAYRIAEDAVEEIGNNVTFEYEGMDFGEEGADGIRICARSPLPENTIHIRFADGEDGGGQDTEGQIVEFKGTSEYAVQEFRLARVTGKKKVIFLFLPGSRFDLKWFRFTKA